MKNYNEPEMVLIMFQDKSDIKTGSDGNVIINPWGGYDSTEEINLIGEY